MARFIFIFLNIVICFLTIVSKMAYSESLVSPNPAPKIASHGSKDTISTIFSDDFESGIFQGWGQTEDWEVSSSGKITGNYSIKHSDKAVSGTSALFYPTWADENISDIRWSFKLKNGNWDPSSSNRFWFYLSADTVRPDLINGWAAGVNISGSTDFLSLWRIKNGKPDSLVVQTDLDWNASLLATITVNRTSFGAWTIEYQEPGKEKSKTFAGTDRTLFNFKNIGLCFKYTSTRAGQLWADDIVVTQTEPSLSIQNLTVTGSHSLSLVFSKPFLKGSAQAKNFVLTDEFGLDIQVLQVIPEPNSDRSLQLRFGNVQGSSLRLRVSGIADLSGRVMIPETRTFSYTFSPEPGSVLINEILFNPFTGGVDFVELVNVSDHSVPVCRLKLATRNDTLALKQIYTVGPENRYLNSGQYLVCTKDAQILASQYVSCNPESFCTMKSVPSFPDDAGTVVLLNDSLEVLDEFSYSAKMHSPFLADVNGVSLERISLEKPASERNNWASAAASVGFATPGLPNSQTQSDAKIQDEIIAEPKAFSPNGDGYNDQLSIRYRFGKPGYLANVRIFDLAGRQVKFLIKNQSLAQEGSWLWNGDCDSGQRLNLGVYIILVEIFDQEGNTKAFKKTCTLTDRLE